MTAALVPPRPDPAMEIRIGELAPEEWSPPGVEVATLTQVAKTAQGGRASRSSLSP